MAGLATFQLYRERNDACWHASDRDGFSPVTRREFSYRIANTGQAPKTLQRVVIQFAGTDADDLIQLADKNFAIANLAGARRLLDGFEDAI